MNRDAHGMAQPASATAEATYQGPAGATRAQAVHLPLVDGTWRTVSVYFGVNVDTHPGLRDAVFSGALHRVDAGAPLAVPFVYHDPARQKLALVVPEELRHRALLERARLLSELADEAGVPVPGYAAEATIVIGLPHLAAYLEAASTHALRLQDEAELLKKAQSSTSIVPLVYTAAPAVMRNALTPSGTRFSRRRFTELVVVEHRANVQRLADRAPSIISADDCTESVIASRSSCSLPPVATRSWCLPTTSMAVPGELRKSELPLWIRTSAWSSTATAELGISIRKVVSPLGPRSAACRP